MDCDRPDVAPIDWSDPESIWGHKLYEYHGWPGGEHGRDPRVPLTGVDRYLVYFLMGKDIATELGQERFEEFWPNDAKLDEFPGFYAGAAVAFEVQEAFQQGVGIGVNDAYDKGYTEGARMQRLHQRN
jgi:hypothetical protein